MRDSGGNVRHEPSPARTPTGGWSRTTTLVVLAVVAAAAALLALYPRDDHGQADAPATTLEKIRRTGEITLGHRENSIPFSYFDNQQHVAGYAHEIAMAIAREAGREAGVPAVKVKLVAVTSQTRIPLLINNTIDLECGTTTNNLARARSVAFTTNYFIAGTRLLVRRDSGIRDFDDLRGRNVVVSAGTTSEIALRQHDARHHLGIRIIAARDHGDAFVALEFGKAVAFMSDDAILFGEMSKAKQPDEWHVVGTPLTREVYACALRKGDPAFKAVADRTIQAMMRDGRMRALYATWFQSPIPPRQVNLQVPFGADLAELYAHPNDRPLQ
ncbi:transporter substrate-binding domain-containing protein [Pseudoxanthomonas sp. z9]|uniref:transporter substrate-binding domain-containing protein n=1 Tax=Pseudoxanthomonas sp. z9 TaxID=2584942 RepID=UPI0015E87BBD|nr:transporter substrate-binding domain-containing protein [Pseudoxanthomonas sp. z9]